MRIVTGSLNIEYRRIEYWNNPGISYGPMDLLNLTPFRFSSHFSRFTVFQYSVFNLVRPLLLLFLLLPTATGSFQSSISSDLRPLIFHFPFCIFHFAISLGIIYLTKAICFIPKC